ncbi:hypothetical protein ACXYMU_18255 [Pontibacter sp. CAU 1760]
MNKQPFICSAFQLYSRAFAYSALFFVVLALFSCAGRRQIADDEYDDYEEGVSEGEVADIPPPVYDGKLLAQVVFDTVDYIVPRQELLQPFIKEFGDGTVVDQVMIRKVQETKEDQPVYYLVGLGIQNGAFRSMAINLDVASDNSLYLSSKGDKHICRASIGCSFCFFTFSGNEITGCECDSRSPANTCSHRFIQGNTLLKDVRLRNNR